MSSLPRAQSALERATEAFYAWELRGRGWDLWPWQVELEPPFEPFPGHIPRGERAPAELDDGRRPGFLGRLFGARPREPRDPQHAPSDAEPEETILTPPLAESSPCGEVRLSGSQAGPITAETARRLLVGLAQPPGARCAFELIGSRDELSLVLARSGDDPRALASRIATQIPGAGPEPTAGVLKDSWAQSAGHAVVVDFGLSEEFVLPLAPASRLDPDPLLSAAAALADLGPGELGVLQVLFAATEAPWASSALRAVSDGAGGCFFADAPQMLPLAREKLSVPLFAVVLRVAAKSSTEERSWEIVRSLGGALAPLARPGSNELIPLADEGYEQALHVEDLLDRSSHRSGMLLNVNELVSLVHPPHPSFQDPRLERTRHTKAAPARAVPDVLLGDNVHRGDARPVGLTVSDRLRHVHIVGATGTGKSTLLERMILQDLRAGRGCAVLDPHGDLIDDLLGAIPNERISDTIVLDPADEDRPVGFNVLEARSEAARTLLSADIPAVFRRLATSWGDQMTTVLANAVLAILASDRAGTLLDLRHFLAERSFREEWLETVADPEVRYFWEHEYPRLPGNSAASILTRLNGFLRSRLLRNVVAPGGGGLDLSDVLSSGKVLLCRVSHGLIGQENAYLLGSLLVAKLHQVVLGRQASEAEAREPFFLYLDEFQHFATPSMCALLSGARKYGLGLVLAHQSLGQLRDAPELKDAVLANAGTRICFRVAEDDARALSRGFAAFDADELMDLARGEAIARLGERSTDFNLKSLGPEPIPADEARRRLEEVTEQSRERYGSRPETPRQVSTERADKPNQEDVRASIPSQPVATKPRSVSEATSPGGRPAEQRAARPRFPTPPAEESTGGGGPEHRYLIHLAAGLARDRGFAVEIEREVPGQSRRIDVALLRDELAIACEISVTSRVEEEIGHVQGALAAGFHAVILVVPRERHRSALSRAIDERLPAAADQTSVTSPEGIATELDRWAPAPAEEETRAVRGYRVRVNRESGGSRGADARRRALSAVVGARLRKRKESS